MARLKDVAEKAQVSLSVASRVLNDDTGARISATTRRRVLAAAEELEYVPDQRARALRLSRAGAIALIVPEVNNAIFASLHAGVHDVCGRRSTAVLLGEVKDLDEGPAQLSQLIGNGRVDGVILQRAERFDDDALAAMIGRVNLPLVLFNSTLPGHTGSVAIDDAGAVRAALEHLAALGHRRIGFLSGAAVHDAAARRREAFVTYAERFGLETRADWIQPAGWEAPAGHDAMTRMLAMSDRPTATLVASLNSALGAMSAAASYGVSVPTDMSVMAIHDTWLAQYSNPPLSTVRLPMDAAGREAATMLLEHLGGAPLRDTVVDHPTPAVVARASTAPPPSRL